MSSKNLHSRYPELVIVTGMSGAGKSSALKALEDLSFEAIDNVPLQFLKLIFTSNLNSSDNKIFEQPIAIGVDIRTRGFSVDNFLQQFDSISLKSKGNAKILFIDCDDDTLHRRYEETRRRHPMAIDRPISDGILKERSLVMPLRSKADLVVNTSEMSLGELKSRLKAKFTDNPEQTLTVLIESFSYRRGLPRNADLILDVRFLKNPHYIRDLREMTGQDEKVGAFILKDPAFNNFFDNLTKTVKPLMPLYEAEGKSYLTIAFGCTGGRHRSVFVAEQFIKWFNKFGIQAQLNHRDINQRRSQ